VEVARPAAGHVAHVDGNPAGAAVHAPSLGITSLPLCGAAEFRHVTMDFHSVTCKSCADLLSGRLAREPRFASAEEGLLP